MTVLADLHKLLKKEEDEEIRLFEKHRKMAENFPHNQTLWNLSFNEWMKQRTYVRGIFDAVKIASESEGV